MAERDFGEISRFKSVDVGYSITLTEIVVHHLPHNNRYFCNIVGKLLSNYNVPDLYGIEK